MCITQLYNIIVKWRKWWYVQRLSFPHIIHSSITFWITKLLPGKVCHVWWLVHTWESGWLVHTCDCDHTYMRILMHNKRTTKSTLSMTNMLILLKTFCVWRCWSCVWSAASLNAFAPCTHIMCPCYSCTCIFAHAIHKMCIHTIQIPSFALQTVLQRAWQLPSM